MAHICTGQACLSAKVEDKVFSFAHITMTLAVLVRDVLPKLINPVFYD